MNAFALSSGDRCWLGRWRSSCFRRLGFGFSVGPGLCFRFGLFGGKTRIHLSGFGGMDSVVLFVRFGQLLLVEEQSAESVCIAQLELVVHFDGFKRADLYANLA